MKKKVRKKTASHKNPYKIQLVSIEKKIDKTYKKLNNHIKKHASYDVIEQDNNELLMLLGECNYLVREFHQFQKKIK